MGRLSVATPLAQAAVLETEQGNGQD